MTENKAEKPIESILVTYEQFSEWTFIPPGSFFIRIATGDYIFYKTASRQKAQQQANLDFPPAGKYSVIPVRDQKTKPRTEFGLSATGSSTRRGQRK